MRIAVNAAFIILLAIFGPAAEAAPEAEGLQGASQVVDEIVVIGELQRFGATKSDVAVSELPRSVSVIPAAEFLERGALTLSNTLDYTAGVVGNAFGYATRGDFTSIRGLDAPEYQDNLQVLFGFYNNARADVYTLEQVEVLKGPASVLYGQAAPGGIVSTVSKVARADNDARELVLTAGNFDRYQASVDLALPLGADSGWSARLVALYRDADTQVDFVTDDAIVLAPSITWENERASMTLLVNYTDRESDTAAQFLPLAATACGSGSITISEPSVCVGTSGAEVDGSISVGDPNFNRYDTEAITVSLFGTYEINEWLAVEGTARYRDNEAEYDQTWISFLGDGNARVLPDGTAVGRSWYSAPAGSTQSAFDVRLRADFDTGGIAHQMLVGANYQDVETEIDAAFIYARPTTFNIFNPVYSGAEIPTAAEFDAVRGADDDETVASDVYLVDTLTVGDLVVNAGIRFSSVDSEDAASDQTDRETPITLGALYRTDLGLNPYVSYAESFRATVGTDVVTGRSLKPRRGEQTEIGLKYQSADSRNFITVAWFDLEEDNLVDFVAGGQTQPGLSIETRGIEVEALLTAGAFTFDFNYRHLDGEEVDENGDSVPRPSLPDDAASLWTRWQPQSGALLGWRAGFGIRYASGNESNGTAFLAANGFAPTPIRVESDGYTVFDAMIGYEFAGFDLAVNLRNLGDEEYYSTCLSRGDCFPGEQRTIVATLARRF
ncbi:MAG: TonB-dependent siderophore receptor [Pseudomonadota bacterium]